jgi:2,3-bisphosphoglycerate-independent phosphoglycerate mutase
MKYLVLIPDGMADLPIDAFGGKTPMEAADKPVMNALAAHSYCGTVSNVPSHMVPESDTANLAILSYDPAVYSKGRSPLEAVSMGLKLEGEDTAIRCNLVTLSEGEPYESRTMLDHSSGEITTEEADELVKALNEALSDDVRHLYTGVSYRHCLVWKGADPTYDFVRPHDIIGQCISDKLPSGEAGAPFLEFMKKGAEVLENHPVNVARRAAGKNPANSPWLWSPGRNPSLPSFKEKWGLDASVISAVDLIKGIGICAGMNVVSVDGATGNYYTNYSGKAEAAISCFESGSELVYVHVEAPDECGHQGDAELKKASVEKIDALILAPVLEYLKSTGEDYRIMILPDHPTPVIKRTHTIDPVPFMIYDSKTDRDGIELFSEKNAAAVGNYISDGSTLMELLTERSPKK